jgi:hypothetical protein
MKRKPVGGWNFMCNVDRVEIDVTNRRAFLYLDKDNSPDMRSTIACFSSADPEVEVIWIVADGKPEYCYVKGESKWEARGYPQ